MKNFIYLLLFLFCLLFSCNITFAKIPEQNNTIYLQGSNLKFVKKYDNVFDLIEYSSKNNKKKVINKNYKIKKKKKDNKLLYIAENEDTIIFYSDNSLFSNILPEYYNQYNNIKFLNYPNAGTIKYKIPVTDKKDSFYYTFISIKDNYINMIKPDKNNSFFWKYQNNYSDISSIMYKLLNISYENLPNCGNFEQRYNIPALINEDVKVEDGKIYITYKNITFQKYPNLKKYINLNMQTAQVKQKKEKLFFMSSDLSEYLKKLENIQDLYNKIEEETPFKFIDYPQNFMLLIYGHPTYTLIFFENGQKTKEIAGTYDNFYFQDRNMLINYTSHFYHLNSASCISYQNQDRIIAHKKGMKWGIIDNKNNEKVPFIYDKILPIGGNVEEEIINIDNRNTNQLIVKYMGKTKEYNLFFAIKDNQIGVIDDKNEIIVNFEPIKLQADLEKSLYINTKKIKDNTAINDIAFATAAILTAPLTIPLIAILSIWF